MHSLFLGLMLSASYSDSWSSLVRRPVSYSCVVIKQALSVLSCGIWERSPSLFLNSIISVHQKDGMMLYLEFNTFFFSPLFCRASRSLKYGKFDATLVSTIKFTRMRWVPTPIRDSLTRGSYIICDRIWLYQNCRHLSPPLPFLLILIPSFNFNFGSSPSLLS